MGIGKSRDYHVKLPSGRVLWRNRRFLRPVPKPSSAFNQEVSQMTENLEQSPQYSAQTEKRKSPRIQARS